MSPGLQEVCEGLLETNIKDRGAPPSESTDPGEGRRQLPQGLIEILVHFLEAVAHRDGNGLFPLGPSAPHHRGRGRVDYLRGPLVRARGPQGGRGGPEMPEVTRVGGPMLGMT